MIKPMIQIHNSQTDEVILREMTEIEIEQASQRRAQKEAEAEADAAKALAKSALLEKLGITEEEARLLLS
jgi:hypothetical protein